MTLSFYVTVTFDVPVGFAVTNPSQEGYLQKNYPLVEGVPHKFTGLHLGGPHIFTGLKYSEASGVGHTSSPVVQFIGLQYSVLAVTEIFLFFSVLFNSPGVAGAVVQTPL